MDSNSFFFCSWEIFHRIYVSQILYPFICWWALRLLLCPQFSSDIQSCLTICDPMNCSTIGLPVHHRLPKLAQTQVHWVGDAIPPYHPLSSPSPPFNLSQHQGLFQSVSSLLQVAKVLEFQLHYQPSQWIFRTYFL